MNDLIPTISLIKLLLLILICVGIYLLIDFLLKLIINWNIRHNSGQRILELEIFFRRIIVLLLSTIVLAGIIMLNPVLHSILFLVLIILGYETLKNIILGTVLHKELELQEGRVYAIAEHSGILVQKSWTGLKLSSAGNKIFIPYSIVFQKGISAKQKSLTFKVFLKGVLQSDIKMNITQDKIKSLLFPLPYIIDGQVPEVYIKENNIYIEAGLISESYLESLRDHLKSYGIQTEIIENKA
jgi:hypothetical protein